MKNLFALAFFSLSMVSAFAAPTFESFKSHFVKYEGVKNKPYRDAGGYSVGIGHFLGKTANINKVYTSREIDNFFLADLKIAKVAAKRVFPNIDSHPENIQIILVSLTFNMGEGGVSKFKKFRAAIEKKNYSVAAAELKDSKWFRQVGNRGRDYIKILNGVK
jgi:lysozyme